jgi:hypothetical protein
VKGILLNIHGLSTSPKWGVAKTKSSQLDKERRKVEPQETGVVSTGVDSRARPENLKGDEKPKVKLVMAP